MTETINEISVETADEIMMRPPTRLRLISPDDATALSALEIANRDFLLSGAPQRSDEYVAPAGQAQMIDSLLRHYRADFCLPLVIEIERQAQWEIVGRASINAISRGPFCSGTVSYWVSREWSGRGIATYALRTLTDRAFAPTSEAGLWLHRLEVATQVSNLASARVIAKAGFVQIGMAPKFLRLGGQWRDHLLFQRINPRWHDESL